MKQILDQGRASVTATFIFGLLLTSVLAGVNRTYAEQAGATPAETSKAPSPSVAAASPTPVAAATPVPPLSSPTMVGPLQMASPNEVNLPKFAPFLSELPAPIANLFDFDVNGVISALGIVQNHPLPGDFDLRGDASNAELIVQKADGFIQYYLQVGGYGIPALGSAYVPLNNCRKRALRCSAGRLSEDSSHFLCFDYGRESANSVRRRVYIHVREHEYRTGPALESGKCDQSSRSTTAMGH
jgi:hypothetical protein